MITKNLSFIILFTTLFICSCSDDDSTPNEPLQYIIEGAQVAPEVGGPNEQNQVYVDLSTNTSTAIQRDSWDLGFYSGSDFRVSINGSIYMAAAQLSATDIDAVSSTDQEVQDLQLYVAVGTFQPQSAEYIDDPSGDISGTAIAAISEVDSENHVYLINLGDEVGTATPDNGSVEVSGGARGWKKIRVLQNDGNYILQYADLDATSHQEISISKNSEYHFTFFSFNTESIVDVQPQKSLWDLNFTVFTNEIEGYGGYGYADFVTSNLKNGVGVYMIDTAVETEQSYNNFTLSDVVDTNFIFDDQRTIGSSWRNGGGPGTLPSLKDNVFYVIQDTDGNLYKLQFIALTDENGERGHPEFVYSLLQ